MICGRRSAMWTTRAMAGRHRARPSVPCGRMENEARKQSAPPEDWRGFYIECRRRPTLPHPDECSTIGAGGLSFRVRDGTGRSPSANTTDNTIQLSPHNPGSRTHHPPPHTQRGTAWMHGCVLRVTQWMRTTKMLWASPRPISTGQLHPSQSFHPRPINPIVSRGP